MLSIWLEIWLNDYKKLSIKPKTFESYETLVRKHINPEIGHILIKDLRAEAIQKLLNEKAVEFSPRQSELIHRVLHSSLEQAVLNDIIIKNPVKATIKPKKKENEARVLTREEQNLLIEALNGHRLKIAFMLMLFTGLRRGEIFGLKWEDIDFKKKTMKISRTLYRVKNYENTDAKTVLKLEKTKTEKSERVIPLFDNLIKSLKEHKKRQIKEKLKLGGKYTNMDLVFCSEFGNFLEPSILNKVLKAATKKVTLTGVTVHTLRHTFATRGLESGIELKVMQELLGHTTINTTADIYTHVLLDKKRESVSKLKDLYPASK